MIYEIKPLNTPSIHNCWILTESVDGQITAAWGFETKKEAQDFLENKVPILRK